MCVGVKITVRVECSNTLPVYEHVCWCALVEYQYNCLCVSVCVCVECKYHCPVCVSLRACVESKYRFVCVCVCVCVCVYVILSAGSPWPCVSSRLSVGPGCYGGSCPPVALACVCGLGGDGK